MMLLLDFFRIFRCFVTKRGVLAFDVISAIRSCDKYINQIQNAPVVSLMKKTVFSTLSQMHVRLSLGIQETSGLRIQVS